MQVVKNVIAAVLLLAAASANAEIVIGQTIALSGSNAAHGVAITKGIDAVIESVNAAGGIGGQRIRIVRLDDAGDSKRAVENAIKLIEKEGAVALFSGIEGGPCTAVTKEATSRKIPVIACAAGAPDLRDPFNRYSFPVRAEHLLEFVRLIDVAATYGYKRLAFLHADSEGGIRHLANVNRVLTARNLPPAIAIPFKSDTPPESVAKILQDQKVDAIFNHGSYGYYAKVIQATRKLDTQVAFLAVNSGAQQIADLLKGEASGMVFTQVVPYPWASTPRVVTEHADLFKRKFPSDALSFSSMEGHINAAVLVAGLKRARSFTPAALVTAFETLGTVDVGGFEVVFTPASRRGAAFVDTVVVSSRGTFVH
ncbi:MAG: ABC transporter substrate-binding protein [Burkholderiaceae bacterium]